MIAERYPEYRGRVAAGLVGHGPERYGVDDALSCDRDFGPGFCLWLTAEDHAAIGERPQADYDALPTEFRGADRRVGVLGLADFYTRPTGSPRAPAPDRPMSGS